MFPDGIKNPLSVRKRVAVRESPSLHHRGFVWLGLSAVNMNLFARKVKWPCPNLSCPPQGLKTDCTEHRIAGRMPVIDSTALHGSSFSSQTFPYKTRKGAASDMRILANKNFREPFSEF